MNPTDQFTAHLVTAFAPTSFLLFFAIVAAIPLSIMAFRAKKGAICYIACIPFILIILFLFMDNCALHSECKGPKIPQNIMAPQMK